MANEGEGEFNRKKSTESVGELYPVLLSKDGQVIDGFHRLEENPAWGTRTLDHIDTEEKLILARAVSNWHRRSVPYAEKVEWINGLARIYLAMGLKIRGERTGRGTVPNEVTAKIIEATGLSPAVVLRHLDAKFKQIERATPGPVKPRVPASQVIGTITKAMGYRDADSLVKRHTEEVRGALLKDEGFQKEILQEMGKDVDALQENMDRPTDGPPEGSEPLNCLCGECPEREKCMEMA